MSVLDTAPIGGWRAAVHVYKGVVTPVVCSDVFGREGASAVVAAFMSGPLTLALDRSRATARCISCLPRGLVGYLGNFGLLRYVVGPAVPVRLGDMYASVQYLLSLLPIDGRYSYTIVEEVRDVWDLKALMYLLPNAMLGRVIAFSDMGLGDLLGVIGGDMFSDVERDNLRYVVVGDGDVEVLRMVGGKPMCVYCNGRLGGVDDAYRRLFERVLREVC